MVDQPRLLVTMFAHTQCPSGKASSTCPQLHHHPHPLPPLLPEAHGVGHFVDMLTSPSCTPLPQAVACCASTGSGALSPHGGATWALGLSVWINMGKGWYKNCQGNQSRKIPWHSKRNRLLEEPKDLPWYYQILCHTNTDTPISELPGPSSSLELAILPPSCTSQHILKIEQFAVWNNQWRFHSEICWVEKRDYRQSIKLCKCKFE